MTYFSGENIGLKFQTSGQTNFKIFFFHEKQFENVRKHKTNCLQGCKQ